jgi:hypothetical protein
VWILNSWIGDVAIECKPPGIPFVIWYADWDDIFSRVVAMRFVC